MANSVDFFTIGIEKVGGEVTNGSILYFFEKLELLLEQNTDQVKRDGVRVFKYYRDPLRTQAIVVPFGKLKGNGTYQEDPRNRGLVQVNLDLYDVNSLYFDEQAKICFLTTDRMAPSKNQIEKYLTSFFNPDLGYCIRLHPIIYNNNIAKLKKADKIRNVTFKFDVSRYVSSVPLTRTNAASHTFLQNMSLLMETGKSDLDNNTFDLKLGMGKDQKGTMDIDTLTYLLEQMDMDQDFVKEVEVHFNDGTQTKQQTARFKSNLCLRGQCTVNEKQLSPEYIFNNGEELISKYRDKCYSQKSSYFSSAVQIEHYELE